MGAASIGEGGPKVHADVHCSSSARLVDCAAMHAYRLVAAPLALFMSATVFACVGDDAPATTPAADASVTDSGSADAGSPVDGGAADASSDAGPACVAPAVTCGTGCADLNLDAANCGRCGHSCLGGACAAGVCRPSVVAGGVSKTVAIRTDGDDVFWIRSGAGSATANIFRRGPTDTQALALAPAQSAQTFFVNLAVTKKAVFVRTLEGANHAVGLVRIPRPTGRPETFKTGPVTDIASTEDGSSLLVATSGAGTTGIIEVFDPAAAVPNPAPLKTFSSENYPISIAALNQVPYWLNAGLYVNGAPASAGDLRRASTQAASTVTSVPNASDGTGLIVTGDRAFWLQKNQPLKVTTTTPSGASVNTFSGAKATALTVAGNAGFVYWTEVDNNSQTLLLTCPIAGCVGGIATVVYRTTDSISALHVDANAIYFAQESDGNLYKLAKP